jgi:hypothetical protein
MKNPFLQFGLCLMIIIGIGCSGSEQEGAEEKPVFRFEKVAEYSQENLPEDKILGTIQGVDADLNGNLYILDGSQKHILKLDKEGNFAGTYGKGEGRGPGEFESPSLFSVTNDGMIYVYDRSMKKVVILDSDNEFMEEFTIGNMPSRMVVDDERTIYITNYGIPFPIKGDKVFKYSPKENGDYELENRFVSLSKEIDTRIRGLAGNSDKMAVRSADTLYFAVWYPYEIRTYTTDGDSLDTFKREVSFFKPPSGNPGQMIESSGRIDEVLPFKNGLIVAQISDLTNSDSTISYFDFWNDEGEFLGSYSEPEVGLIEGGRDFISQGGHFLFVTYNDPEPTVIKYRLLRD